MYVEFDILNQIKRIHAGFTSKKKNKLACIFKNESMQKYVRTIHDKSYSVLGVLNAEGRWSKEPLSFEKKLEGIVKTVSVGTVWADDVFDCMWVHMTADITALNIPHDKLVFLVDLGGEGLVVDKNGVAKQSITCYASDHDYSLGKPEKKIVLNHGFAENCKVDFWIDAAANDLFGYFHDKAKVCQLDIALENTEIRGLAFDMDVLLSAYSYADNETGKIIMTALEKVRKKAGKEITESSAKELRLELVDVLSIQNDTNPFTYSMIGHAHLDLAWLWPIRESYRKGVRTFSNQLMNLDKFPNYKFGASQAQLYEWIKRDSPDVHNRMSEYIKQGRWEVQGATWVEMDSNLTSGESLIRQFYYGKKYFMEEFGEDMKILWLPDSFGYSPCLPQVMKLANVPYFLTQKMSWNAVTKFPHHTFNWQGLDGSTVFAHMLPESTYNSPCRADKMTFGVKNYQEADKCRKAIMLAGIGDGGAGPGFEHLERADRLCDLKPLPLVKVEKSVQFFDDLVSDKDIFSTYKGELYLEKHQGTYTTQNHNKWYNRKCEFALRNYEYLLAILGNNNLDIPITLERLEVIWKEILLYQFHDILPGSSIDRVYVESVARYEELYNEINAGIDKLLPRTSKGKSIFNSNSFDYDYTFKSGNKWSTMRVNALSSTLVTNATAITSFSANVGDNFIENDKVIIKYKYGSIISYFDKDFGREFVSSGKLFGEYSMYSDMGDCWDIKSNYAKSKKSLNCISFKTRVDGPTASAVSVFRLGNTVVKQTMKITDGESMARASVELDFKGEKQMLRVSFDTQIESEVCNFNTQFGHFARPTSDNNKTEKAQFEVSGQKFIDLSDTKSGISIINDSKYGFRCKGGVMDICLARNAKGGPSTQECRDKSVFEYAIFAHKGTLGMDTYKNAYLINNPLIEIDGNKNCVSHNINIDNENIVLESVKIADNGGAVLRLYNSSEVVQKVNVKMNGMSNQSIVDIMENELSVISKEVEFNPFELKCIKCIK